MTEDQKKAALEWGKKATDATLPKLKESNVFLGLATMNYAKDPLCVLQIGYAMMLDKPIMLIADRSQPIPKKLLKIADQIEYANLEDPKDVERATQALIAFAEKTVPK